jgi:hypothetical protein
MSHYDGDPRLSPSDELIDACRHRLLDIAGDAVDLGVLTDGRSALVEVNDGFAVGRYGLEPGAYAEMLLTRWRQLVLQAGSR